MPTALSDDRRARRDHRNRESERRGRQHAGLQQVLRDELRATRADHFAEPYFASAPRGSRGREIRVVHASHEQHERAEPSSTW